jgi:hypothetical protein
MGAKKSGLPVRILWASDLDDGGVSMPVVAARKIEYWLRETGNTHLDIQVRRIALTPEQCEQYDLPQIPMKPNESRAEKFKARYGRDATEVDALEALHAGLSKPQRRLRRHHAGLRLTLRRLRLRLTAYG